ncbi:MAG: hypothetical protein ACK4F9_00355 [Brevinematia bacterium]
METKFIRVLSIIGDFAIVSIDGKKVKARVEGKIPSYTFMGEVIKDNDRIIIRVKDSLAPFKDIGSILSQIELPRNQKNYLITKILMSLSLPILKEYYGVLGSYDLPYLISGMIIKHKSKYQGKYLAVTEKLFKDFMDGKVSAKEFAIFVDNFIISSRFEEFRIFWIEEEEKWFSRIEFDEDGFRKLVLTTEIEGVKVLVIFERFVKRYDLSIILFSNNKVYVTSDSKLELKRNLESLGFNPIYIDIEEVFE